MDEDRVRQLFEEIDPQGQIPESRIDELIAVMKDQELHPLKDGDKIGDAVFNTLNDKMENEPDWRKKAALAARIISASLD
jgi:hypothetical protein